MGRSGVGFVGDYTRSPGQSHPARSGVRRAGSGRHSRRVVRRDDHSPPAQSPWLAGEQHRPSRDDLHHRVARLRVLDDLCTECFSASAIGITNTVIAAMTLVAILTVAGFIPMLTRLLPGASPEERSGTLQYRIRRHRRRIGRRRRCRGAAPARTPARRSRHRLARSAVGCRRGGHRHAARGQRGVAGRPPGRALPAGQRRGERVTARRYRGNTDPRSGRRRCRC